MFNTIATNTETQKLDGYAHCMMYRKSAENMQ